MPGHIKKTSGPDPDPSPWLEVKPELKMKLKAKPYDPKKSVWVNGPKSEGGYLEGLLESKEGGQNSPGQTCSYPSLGNGTLPSLVLSSPGSPETHITPLAPLRLTLLQSRKGEGGE